MNEHAEVVHGEEISTESLDSKDQKASRGCLGQKKKEVKSSNEVLALEVAKLANTALTLVNKLIKSNQG